MSWRLVLTLLLLAGALVSGWSVWTQREDHGIGPGSSGRSDYVLHDFELVALDDTGKESFTLRAPRMTRDPDDRTLTMVTPLFLLPDVEQHYWQVRARSGWIAADGDELRLRGDVRVASPPQAADKILLKTRQLNIFPHKRLVTSRAVVTVTEPGLTMRGRGVKAHLPSKRFTFLSQATAHYVPSPR